MVLVTDHLAAIVGLNSDFLRVWSIGVLGLTVLYGCRQGVPAVCRECAINMMHLVHGIPVRVGVCVDCVVIRRLEEEVAAAGLSSGTYPCTRSDAKEL